MVKSDRLTYKRPREPEDVWLPCEGNRGIQRILRKVIELGGNYPDQRWWSTSLGKFIRRLFGGPPTGFSEPDVRPSGVECDVGLKVMREIFSRIMVIEFPREYNSLGTSNDEVFHGNCLTVDSTRIQT
jgi:hypothetical protein